MCVCVAFDRREEKQPLWKQSWANDFIGSSKGKSAVAEQWKGPAYISDGQEQALGEDIEASLRLGEEIVAQQLHSYSHGFKEGMQMRQRIWWEQRQIQHDEWYAKEQWGEDKWEDRQLEYRQWDEDKWSHRDDPRWDEQRRSTPDKKRMEWLEVIQVLIAVTMTAVAAQ